MQAPRYTIIIPAIEFSSDLPSLVALRRLIHLDRKVEAKEIEVIVATGRSPSAQRNAAAERARGEFLLFLDSDSEPDADYFHVLAQVLGAADPPYDVLGGPALLLPGAPYAQRLFQEVLSHAYIVGPTAARYSPVGQLRSSTERELILCNLVVRRLFFKRVGPLNEKLYPNEENDWLDRAARLVSPSARIGYDPALRIHRPQRGSWREFSFTLIRYGRGRTQQFLRSGIWNPAKQGLVLGIVLFGLSFLVRPVTTFFVALAIGIVAAGAIAITWGPSLPLPKQERELQAEEYRPVARWHVALVGLTVPLFYGIGQIIGFLPLLRSRPAPLTIELWDEQGQPLVKREGNRRSSIDTKL